MALRFSCKAVSIGQAGTAFTHSITAPASGNAAYTASAPDEWALNWRQAPPAAANLYVTVAPTSTTITVASDSGTGTADIFAWVNHKIMT